MTRQIHLKDLWFLSTLIGLVFTQNLQLYDYSQNDSETQCESGLLQNIDQIGFKAEVTLSNDNDTMHTVGFSIKTESAELYDSFESLSLEYDCDTGNRRNKRVKCVKQPDKKYSIAVLTQAESMYSGAIIKGYIDFYTPDAKSIQLPKIYEPTDASGELTINDHIMDKICDKNVTSENLDVAFKCSSSAQPCRAEIYLNGSKVGKTEKNAASYSGKVENGELHLMIKYAACRLDGKYKTINCTISVDQQEEKETSQLYKIHIVLGVTIPFAFVCILILCITRRNYLIKKILLHAAKKGHLKIISLLKRSKVIHTATSPEGMPLLTIASEFGHTDIAKLLIELKVNVNQKSSTGKTPIDLELSECFTALMKATEFGRTENVKILIKHGANVNQQSSTGKYSNYFTRFEEITALMKASECGHTEIVKLLTEREAAVNERSKGKTAKGFDLSENVTALTRAAELGHTEIVKLLIEHGAKVNKYSSTTKTANGFKTIEHVTALMKATEIGHTEIVKLLIERKANLDDKSTTEKIPIDLTTPEDATATERVNLLIEPGSSESLTALMKASELGHTEIVKLLIENGADVNQKSSTGKTAIDFARTNKHHDIVKLLQGKSDK